MKRSDSDSEKLNKLWQCLADAVLVIDKSGTVTEAYGNCEEVLGYRCESLPGFAFRDLLPERDRKILDAHLDATSPLPLDGKARPGIVLRADGREARAEFRFQALGEEAVGIIRDTSSQHALSTELSDQKSQFADTLEAANVGIMTFDQAGNIVHFNHEARIMFSEIEDLARATVHDLRRHYSLEGGNQGSENAAETPVIAALRGKTIDNVQLTIRSRASELRHRILLNASPLRDHRQHIKGAVVCVKDITAVFDAHEKIHHQAHYDALTDLPNRRQLLNILDRAINDAQENKNYGAVLFVDLDDFKSVNDVFGHEFGDHLLVAVAQRIKRALRPNDIVSRLGGDEFVCVLPELMQDPQATATHASLFSERILSTISKPFFVDDHKVATSCSIGIVIFPEEGSTPENILQFADTALYAAKDTGKKGYITFHKSMTARIARYLELQIQLHNALHKDIFHLVFQPQYDPQNELVGAEVLLRCKLEDGTPVFPNDFIPILEQTGEIVDVGYWIIKQSFSTLLNWKQEGLWPAHAHLSVNISARQLKHQNFLERIKAYIVEYHIDPRDVVFEITENIMVGSENQVIEVLTRLNDMQIALSMDDFGTGYSSLGYLKNLPLSYLKIDKCFVDDLGDGDKDQAIVHAIIAVCKEFNLKVVGEGVETEIQRDILWQSGCHYVQGYLYSKPIDTGAMTKLLHACHDNSD